MVDAKELLKWHMKEYPNGVDVNVSDLFYAACIIAEAVYSARDEIVKAIKEAQ